MHTISVFDASHPQADASTNSLLKKRKSRNQSKDFYLQKPKQKTYETIKTTSNKAAIPSQLLTSADKKVTVSPEVTSQDLRKIKTEASQELLKEEKKSEKKLDELVERSQVVLLNISNIFPFDFFPDNITIDMNKINVVKKNFWKSGRVHSIYIKNVVDVFVESTPFFATLKIVASGFVENEVFVNYLRKKDANLARRIIQGLVVASKEGVNLSSMPIKDVKQKIVKLGVESETQI